MLRLMTVTLRVLASSALLLAWAVGCGGQVSQANDTAPAPSAAVATSRDRPCNSQPGDALGLVGLSEADAEAEAKAEGYMFRVACREGAGVPGDLAISPQRVNVTLVEGQVTAASIG